MLSHCIYVARDILIDAGAIEAARDKKLSSLCDVQAIIKLLGMNMSRGDVILGREWLHGLGSSLKQSYEHNTIAFKANGKHYVMQSSLK